MVILVDFVNKSEMFEQCMRGDHWPNGQQHHCKDASNEPHDSEATQTFQFRNSLTKPALVYLREVARAFAVATLDDQGLDQLTS